MDWLMVHPHFFQPLNSFFAASTTVRLRLFFFIYYCAEFALILKLECTASWILNNI